ncbi:GNRR2 protein, partial [Thinocorus orbignyianus]|nr:GNRR2 protein [Thinocorus orbignyianus]
EPDPAVGNTSADPSMGLLSPEQGCAWTPQAEGGEEPAQLPTFSPAAQARVAVTFLLFALSAGGNLAVLRAAGGRQGSRRSHICLLLRHLAAADLLVTVAVMPLDAVWNITLQWRGGDLACRLLMYLRLLAMYASAFVTVVISLDRQAAILRPLAIARARRRNRAMLYAAWLLSAVLSVPQVPSLGVPSGPVTRGSGERSWHRVDWGSRCQGQGLTLWLCWSLAPDTGALGSRDASLRCSRNNIPRARLRMLKMSLIIVSSFILCWTPYYLLGLWHWFCPRAVEKRVSPALAHILFIFGLFNACLDPITYGLFTIPFRRGWGCPRGHSHEPQPPSPATGSFQCSTSSL